MFTRYLRGGLVSLLIGLAIGAGASAQRGCPTPPLFEAGDIGQITPGAANNVRDTPSASGEAVGQLPGGAIFAVTGEVACDETFTWVPVRYGGVEGWTVQGTASDLFMFKRDDMRAYRDKSMAFIYPVALGERVEAEWVPPSDTMSGLLPQFLRYTIEPQPDVVKAYLYVFPVEDVTDEMRLPTRSLSTLRPYLSGAENLSDPVIEITPPNGPLRERFFPTFPIGAGASRILVARQREVPVQDGRGVAFLSYSVQQIQAPLLRSGMRYTYVGLTDDARYLVAAWFPVTTPLLPITIPHEDLIRYEDYEAFRAYIETTTAQLTASDAAEWDPNLDTLDAMIGSLAITPGWEDSPS